MAEMDPKNNIEKLMDEKDVQFRSFHLTNIEKRAAEDGTEEMIVEGIACTFNQETVLYKGKYYEDREKIDPSAFAECDMTDVIFNMNHCGRVYARTRNGSLELSVQSDGLHMKAKLLPEDRGHEELYRDIKEGLLDRMSFAFHVEESEYNYLDQDGGDYTIYTRTIKKIDKLYDVSAVDIPAYDTTSISARRAFDTVREERQAESLRAAKENEEARKRALELYNYYSMEA